MNKRFEKIDERFDQLAALMSSFANDVSQRFDKHDIRFEQQEAHFDRIEEQLRLQNGKYDHLVTMIDGFLARIDKYETELSARDHKIERLER